jgi:G:T-mismatch repair DNA endonuclease (very short patch repair protein)
MQQMPTGIGKHYMLQPQTRTFIAESMDDNRQSELNCMAWESECRGIEILHRWSNGKDVYRRGKQVDGYHAPSKTCFFFDGCYFHGCKCQTPKRKIHRDPKEEAERQERWQKNAKRAYAVRAYLREKGYTVVVIKECDFNRYKGWNLNAKDYMSLVHGMFLFSCVLDFLFVPF